MGVILHGVPSPLVRVFVEPIVLEQWYELLSSHPQHAVHVPGM